MKCKMCGKEAQFGHSVSHSKRRTLRRWLPNIQRTTVMVDGKKAKIAICTRCLRTQYKTPR